MTPADRLREKARAMRAAVDRDARELEALADEMDGASATGELSAWASVREVQSALGLTYDAARMRVDRDGAGRTVAGQKLVSRAWLTAQIDDVRSVRSVAEQPSDRASSRN